MAMLSPQKSRTSLKHCKRTVLSLYSRTNQSLLRSCTGGLASVPETTALLAHLVTLDAIKLLTGNGIPINNTNLEEVIQVVAKSIKRS